MATTRTTTRLLPMLAVAALVAGGCGDDDTGLADTGTGTTSSTGVETTDGGTSAPSTATTAATSTSDGSPTTTESTEGRGGEVVSVGNLWTDGGPVLLCRGLAESFPPGCAEPSVELEALDLDDVVGSTTEQGITWTEYPLAVVGDDRGATFAVRELASPTASVDEGDLSVRATYAEPVEPGDPYWWVVELVNVGGEPITIVFPSGQRLDAAISAGGGDSVYTWSADKSFIQAIEEITLAPGSAASFTANDPVALDDGDYEVTISATASVDGDPLPAVELPLTVGG